MKKTIPHFRRVVNFASAMLIAFAGMTGAFATAGLSESLEVSALNEYDFTLSSEFFNLKTENDKVTVYNVLSEDGTVKNGTKTVIKTIDGNYDKSLNGEGEIFEVEQINGGKKHSLGAIAVRSINGGSQDYFWFTKNNTWTYLGTNPFIVDEWTKNGNPEMIALDSFTLENYSYVSDKDEEGWETYRDTSDRLTIFSTMLNNDDTPHATTIATLIGSKYTLKIPNDSRYGYTAERIQGGAPLDAFYGMESEFKWDAENNEWSCYYSAQNEKAGASYKNILTLPVNKKTFPMLADYNVKEVCIYQNGELIQKFDKEAFDAGNAYVTQYFDVEETYNKGKALGFCRGNEYEQYSWSAVAEGVYQFGKEYYEAFGNLSGKFIANIPYTGLAVWSSDVCSSDLLKMK